jgi:uncharacterized protein (DUF362 family)
MQHHFCSRRSFLRVSATAALASPLAASFGLSAFGAAAQTDTNVAIVPCKTYGAELAPAMEKAFDLVGGLGSLVKGKTVAVKVNLTGTNFQDYMGRPVGETYMTHEATVHALAASLFKAGAKRVRFLESTQSRASLESTLDLAGWDLKKLGSLGKVEYENTRNLGLGTRYATLKVPTGGHMFSAIDVNHSYADTDVMVSLCKMKNHVTAGVTLSMKNMFGLTPNSLYGDEAGNEDATAGRGPLHNPKGFEKIKLPGLKEGIASTDPTWRVPRIIVDEMAARPVHLSIIDGITAMSGGEGPWCSEAGPIKFTNPGVIIVGKNPVSTDAVGTAVMGYADPRAVRGTKPFLFCDNHLAMAEQAGLGTADLSKIDVRGMTIEKARYKYAWL